MATLYEIDSGILDCCGSETGEIIDAERLDALLMERNAKIEGVACWVKNLESDALAYKAEKDAFAAREKAALNKAEQLKKYLVYALGGQKYTGHRCAIGFRKSVQVEVENADNLPADLVSIITTIKPDKRAIKAMLESGQEVKGCRLVEHLNTQIK